MTQKGNLYKGQSKKKSIPSNHHGKAPQIRKGRKFVKPLKITKEMELDREVGKFINRCNEVKASTLVLKNGGQLSFAKPSADSTTGEKK